MIKPLQMKMCYLSGLLAPLFILSSLVLVLGQDEITSHSNSHDLSKLKASLIGDIVQKVCNISLLTLSSKTAEEKEALLLKIEQKLDRSAQNLGDNGKKYVKLLMKAVRSQSVKSNNHSSAVRMHDKPKKPLILRNDSNLPNPLRTTIQRTKSKDQLIDDIAKKMEILAKKYFKDAQTLRERQIVLESLKRKLIETVDQTEPASPNKHEVVKSYVELLAKGIASMNQRNNEKKMQEKIPKYNSNSASEETLRDGSGDFYKPVPIDVLNHNKIDQDDNFRPEELDSVSFSLNKSANIIPHPTCHDSINETCNKIRLVQQFQCQSDNTEVHISKLCDGINDCIDSSDEQQCAKQAMQSIQKSNLLMNYIETSLSRKCYPDILDEKIISKQNQILSNVLQNQLNFLHSYEMKRSSKHYKTGMNSDSPTIKKTAQDAVSVVNTLTSALEASLCPTDSSKLGTNKKRTVDDSLDKDIAKQLGEVMPTALTPESCKCDGPKNARESLNRDDCHEVCEQLFSLGQWRCPAVNEGKFVPLDTICDGKLDCYDESDENSCTKDVGMAKFEAIQMYNYILDTIISKTKNVAFELVRAKLQNLHALVTSLQQLTLKRQPDVGEIKNYRDEAFADIVAIYRISLHYYDTLPDSIGMYAFLLSLSEKLVNALKRSHTGNDKIIQNHSANCLCKDFKCAMWKCTSTCSRICSAEPILTKYLCKGASGLNNSVPIDVICNGRQNCPEGDDELNCRPDICRKHHIVLLRHNLREAGESHYGTAIGEALRAWSVKVSASLVIAESQIRPSPQELRVVVQDTLNDLLLTYANMEEGRRSSTTVYKEFAVWARLVMNTLKSCTK